MTMSRMKLNSKFVNNMLPEWGRFVTAVKFNRELRDSNYDQLYAYLKQNKTHANENKMMLDRFSQHIVDPLALMSNVSHPRQYSPSSSTLPSTYVPPHLADNAHLDLGLSPTNNLIENLTNTLALLTQSYKTFLPQTNNQLRTSSNTRNQATVQDCRVVNRGQGNNARGVGAAGYGGAQNRVGYANPGQARQIKCYNCNDIALNVHNVFQADDCDAFDSDVDEAHTAPTMFMTNLSSADHVYDEAGTSYDSDVLSETTTLTTTLRCVTINSVTPKVLALGMYAIDVKRIPPHLKNNRKVHLDYLKHLKESVATLREIVEEAKVERPLDRSAASACLYTKHS
nr:hypothetical protein [Tanacetum cinerariifolium]